VDHHNVEVMEKKIREIHITDDSHSSVHPLPPLPPNNEESQKMLSGGGGGGGNNSDNDDSEETPSTPRFYGSGLVGSSNNGLKIEALEASSSSSSSSSTITTTNASSKRQLSAMDAARQAALRRREEAIQKLSEEDALYLEKRQKSVLIGKIEACYAQMKKVTTITSHNLSRSHFSHTCVLYALKYFQFCV
jgi:hypothetical protein